MKNNFLYNDIKLYLAYLQFERRLSSNTINSYWLDLKRYADYLSKAYQIDKISLIKSKHIKNYIKNINSFKNNNINEILH